MKSLLLVTSMAIISQFAQADSTSISAIDTAANHMNVKSLQSLAQQGDDYQQAYAGYRLAISANILGQQDLAISALESAKHPGTTNGFKRECRQPSLTVIRLWHAHWVR